MDKISENKWIQLLVTIIITIIVAALVFPLLNYIYSLITHNLFVYSFFVFILYKIFTIGNSKNEKNVNKVAYKEWEKIEQNRIDDFNDFLKSENYEIISRLDSIPYLPEPHDVELCGDDYL